MKKIFNYVCIASGMIAMLASCQKEEVTVPESGTINMVITASQDNNTKTTLGIDGKVTWNATGEKLRVYEISTSEGSATTAAKESSNGVTTNEGQTMNFSVSFSSLTADSFDYLALYPTSSFVTNSNTDPASLKVEINATQTPTATSFDGSNDILVAQAVTGLTSQPTELSFAFKRMSSVGKMTISNLSSSENVKTIKIQAAGKTLTGRSKLNLNDASVVEYGYSGQGTDYVELDYSEQTIAANGMTAYFCVWPCTIKVGDEITVTVKTETKTYTKNITASKELSFSEGGMSKFSVDFSGIIADEDSSIKNGSISFGKNNVVIDEATESFKDNLNYSWTVTTTGTTSFTTGNTAYMQIGSSKKPATSITFVGTLPASKNVTSVSAKFGGFSDTAGSVSIKVGDTEVGSGALDGANDVTVSSSSPATGSTITITVTGIAKGVKVYSIDYTYTD